MVLFVFIQTMPLCELSITTHMQGKLTFGRRPPFVFIDILALLHGPDNHSGWVHTPLSIGPMAL